MGLIVNKQLYIIDGYIIFRNKNIEHFCRDREEKWKEKVINLKGLQPTENDMIPLTDLKTILEYLTNKFEVFQISTKSENTCYLGRLESIDSKELIIYTLNPKGKWDGQTKFRNSDIRFIEFETDYICSLKLVGGTKSKK